LKALLLRHQRVERRWRLGAEAFVGGWLASCLFDINRGIENTEQHGII
jgi:hypothetical protein